MDRYGASTRGYGDEYDFDSDLHRIAAKSIRFTGPRTRSRYAKSEGEDDYLDDSIGHRGGALHGDATVHGERGGRRITSRYEADDLDLGAYNQPTRCGISDRHGAGPGTYTNGPPMSRGGPREIADRSFADFYDGETVADSSDGRYDNGSRMARGDESRRRRADSLMADIFGSDSGFEHEERSVRGTVVRRGVEPRSRYTGDHSDDDSKFEPRATRGERRTTNLRSAGSRAYDTSSIDDESDYEHYRTRQGHGRGAPRGTVLRRSGRGAPSAYDVDDYSDDVRGGRREATGY